MVLHGHLRFTADLDLALALDPANVESALDALEGLGYRPRAPLPLRSLADPGRRAQDLEDVRALEAIADDLGESGRG